MQKITMMIPSKDASEVTEFLKLHNLVTPSDDTIDRIETIPFKHGQKCFGSFQSDGFKVMVQTSVSKMKKPQLK